VAVAPLQRASFTPTRLAERIRQVLSDEPLQHRAKALASRMRAEDGVAQAVAYIARQQMAGQTG
jgi:UDP:flavonoid glycosyltransferase YjiC (YdhE family)